MGFCISSPSAWYTMRWRATVGLSGKARRDDGEPPVGAAAVAVAGMAGVLLALVDQVERRAARALPDARGFSRDAHVAGFSSHVFCEHQRLADDEEQHQPHAAEQLEVHPASVGVVEGDVQVGAPMKTKNADPAPVEARARPRRAAGPARTASVRTRLRPQQRARRRAPRRTASRAPSAST